MIQQSILTDRLKRSSQKRENGFSFESLEDRRVMSADLSPSLVQVPEVASLQAVFPIDIQIENHGSADSGEYNVQLRLSLDATIDGFDRVITPLTRDSIPAGGVDRWQELIKIPDGVPQGEFYVGISVDPTNNINESDETNNSLTTSDTIHLLMGLPNLAACDTFGTMGTEYQTGTNCRATEVDGYLRTQIVYVPEGVLDSDDPVPMVTMLHGTTGHGLRFYNSSGWKEKADEVGLVAVFPTSVNYCEVDSACENGRLNGWTTKWHSEGFLQSPDINFDYQPPTYPESSAWPAADVDFIETVWSDVESSLPIDADRIYVSGFSNGGGMTRHLMFETPERLAAVGYAGGFGMSSDPEAASSEPKPLSVILGTKDPKMLGLLDLPANGEIPLDPPSLLSLPKLTDFITQTLSLQKLSFDPNNLRPDAIQRNEISTRLTWSTPEVGNDSGNVFHLFIWKDLEHQYPYQVDANKNPHGFDATEAFWRFFEMHTGSSESAATADLVPTSIASPELGSLDEVLFVDTQVENLGQSASGEYSIQYLLSTDDVIDGKDRVLFSEVRSSIPAEGSERWNQPLQIPDGVPQGTYHIAVVVDPLQAVVESDETNNQLVALEETQLVKGLPLSQCDTFGNAGTTYETGVNCRVVDIDGYPRTFITYVPENIVDGEAEVPLVTMLHGSSGNGGQFLNISGWREKADEQGLVAVFPTSVMYCKIDSPCENGFLNGFETKWGHTEFANNPSFTLNVMPPGYPADAPSPASDLQFINAVLDDVESLLPIDTNRIFGSGFSAGAQMTRNLGFDLSHRYASVGYVGSGLGLREDPPQPTELVSLYTVLGTTDPKMIDALGHDAALPLDPVELFSISNFHDFVTKTLTALQLEFDPNNLLPDVTQSDDISTRLSWHTPMPGNDSGNSFHVSIWADLIHHYPFRQSADKNPNGFVAVDTFWEFFERTAKDPSPSVPGDSNGDGVFNSSDLLLAFQAGEYEDDIDGNSTVEEGDWNGDGDFNAADIIFAFQNGSYEFSAMNGDSARTLIFDHSDESRFEEDLRYPELIAARIS